MHETVGSMAALSSFRMEVWHRYRTLLCDRSILSNGRTARGAQQTAVASAGYGHTKVSELGHYHQSVRVCHLVADMAERCHEMNRSCQRPRFYFLGICFVLTHALACERQCRGSLSMLHVADTRFVLMPLFAARPVICGV